MSQRVPGGRCSGFQFKGSHEWRLERRTTPEGTRGTRGCRGCNEGMRAVRSRHSQVNPPAQPRPPSAVRRLLPFNHARVTKISQSASATPTLRDHHHRTLNHPRPNLILFSISQPLHPLLVPFSSSPSVFFPAPTSPLHLYALHREQPDHTLLSTSTLLRPTNFLTTNNHEDESNYADPILLKLTSVYALILVGGFGTRLRPLTVRVHPRLRRPSVCGTPATSQPCRPMFRTDH